MCKACRLRVKDPGYQEQVPGETSPHLLLRAQHQRLGAEQDQLPCGPTGTSSCNCEGTDTSMLRACRVLWQLLKNHAAGHLTHNGFQQKRLEGDLCWIVSHASSPSSPRRPNRSWNWSWQVFCNLCSTTEEALEEYGTGRRFGILSSFTKAAKVLQLMQYY